MTRRTRISLGRLTLALALIAEPASAQSSLQATDASAAHPELWPAASSPAAFTDAKTEAFITQLMARMTLEEKVGQTIQADINSITPDDLRRYPIGALLAGGNSSPGGDEWAPPQKWVELIEAFRHAAAEKSPIPLIFGIDAVHGHSNIVGATIFPHNIGLGAAHDPELVRRIASATAEEVAVTGMDWTFAPTLAVPQDERWGRAYEGYSSDPELVKSYAAPAVLGLQGKLEAGRSMQPGNVIASAKHFLADGGTDGGKDQGDASISESELVRLHAQGYPPAIDAGALTVLVSFSSWHGVKHVVNKSLLTDVLKGRMGFEGFVVDDWNAVGEVKGCTNEDCPQAMNAGLDMYMAPDSWKGLYEHTLAEVRSGVIPQARLDDAVRRILRVKLKAGLFANTRPLEGHYERLGAPDHRALAREAVRKSLVLLKNNGSVLPIRAGAHVLVAGDGADDIGKLCGGWTITWQGTGNKNKDFPNGQSVWSGIDETVRAAGGQAELAIDGKFKTRPDVAVVVFGEDPYAEFQGDIPNVAFADHGGKNLALLRSLKAQGIPVVAVFISGRPLWINPEINAADAVVAAWLPGSEGGGVADVLIGDAKGQPRFDFIGRLAYPWPMRADQAPLDEGRPGYDPLFGLGYGLSYAHPGAVGVLSEDPGAVSSGPNVDRYFEAGRAVAPWSLGVDGSVSVKAVDAGAQENARQATWRGQGALVISGPAADLSRQTTGVLALTMRYRLDRAPTGPVTLGVGCGPGCGVNLDVSSLIGAKEGGDWRTLSLPLPCFRAKGARMEAVSEPFRLESRGPMTLTFSEIRLSSEKGDPTCPVTP